MSNEFINQFNDTGKASYETFQQFNEINVETMQKLAALQFSLTNLNVESTVEQAKLLTSGSAPNELFAAESAWARAYGEELNKITNETTAVMSDSREQLVAFTGKTLQIAQPATTPAPTKKKARKKAVKKAA